MRISLVVCLLVVVGVILLGTWFCWRTHRDFLAMLRTIDVSGMPPELQQEWSRSLEGGEIPSDFGFELSGPMIFRIEVAATLEHYRWWLIVILLLSAFAVDALWTRSFVKPVRGAAAINTGGDKV